MPTSHQDAITAALTDKYGPAYAAVLALLARTSRDTGALRQRVGHLNNQLTNDPTISQLYQATHHAAGLKDAARAILRAAPHNVTRDEADDLVTGHVRGLNLAVYADDPPTIYPRTTPAPATAPAADPTGATA